MAAGNAYRPGLMDSRHSAFPSTIPLLVARGIEHFVSWRILFLRDFKSTPVRLFVFQVVTRLIHSGWTRHNRPDEDYYDPQVYTNSKSTNRNCRESRVILGPEDG